VHCQWAAAAMTKRPLDGLPTKWRVLILDRLWLYHDLPHNSETVAIAKALRMVGRRWLKVHWYGPSYSVAICAKKADFFGSAPHRFFRPLAAL